MGYGDEDPYDMFSGKEREEMETKDFERITQEKFTHDACEEEECRQEIEEIEMLFRCVLKPNGLRHGDGLWTMIWDGFFWRIRRDIIEALEAK